MSAKHTPGPLTAYQSVVLFSGNAGGFDIRGCPSADENARRLAACWNACDGIDTEHLERHGLPDFAQKISGLVAQRDEMLEALNGILIRVADDEDYGPDHAVTVARAAIAKATGGAA